MKPKQPNRRALNAAEIKRAEELDHLMKKHRIDAGIVGCLINRSRYTVHSYRAKRRPMSSATLRELKRAISARLAAYGEFRRALR